MIDKNKIKKLVKTLGDFVDQGGKITEQVIKKILKPKNFKKLILTLVILGLFFGGLIIIWISTFDLPNIDSFEERQVAQSTKIYDRTGDVVLFDVHGNVKRTVVPFDKISDYVKLATVAVEDSNFYNHNGIEIKAIFRAILVNIKNGDLLGGQGGSTITQQVIKNALLTTDKKVSRKIKEWVLAPRLEKILTKDEILHVYLNEVPYGGTVYGVQEASQRFFSKNASDLTLAESAYIASLPQAPTYFSPYGNNRDKLELRKNFVLKQMLENSFITEDEYQGALAEVVDFEKQEEFGIKAAHFVMYIREQLEEKYGKEAVEQDGLKVITTLDWDLQEKAEEIVFEAAEVNKNQYNAENGALVAIDPNNGQILTMVGSRNYFDDEIDGNFNIATAKRQPGSSFKPFVYAEAFNKGYTPETIVFDLSTEFSTACASGGSCYRPTNFTGQFRGPISLREALAQSINVPAVKVLYLAGLNDSLKLASKMGITTLNNPNQYGLTLVLGGGEVTPLEMASAYSVFASGGIKNQHTGILKIEDRDGNVLEEYKDDPTRVLPAQTAYLISDILSDNVARAPVFGSNSPLYFPGRDVAVKTGTTNNFRDAWIVGYTPSISVSAWIGNNDNTPIDNRAASFIVAPVLNKFMQFALDKYRSDPFPEPDSYKITNKPMLNGYWRGESVESIDGDLVVTGGGNGIHSILHFVNRADPLGPAPRNPASDPQYNLWEAPIREWVVRQGISNNVDLGDIKTKKDLTITHPQNLRAYPKNDSLKIEISFKGQNPLVEAVVLLNGNKIGNINLNSNDFYFVPADNTNIEPENIIEIKAVDESGKEFIDSILFGVID